MIDPNGLLMIEPRNPSEPPIEDRFTDLAREAWERRVASRHSYRGWHTCACGACSDNREWWVDGRLTNSLMVHYVREHRSEVPPEELAKLEVHSPQP